MGEEEIEDKGSPKIVAIVVAAVVVAVVGFVLFGQKKEFTPVGVGTEVVEFSLPDLDGEMRSFSDYKGRVIFLNFWATWCKPCEEEMPSMQHLHQTFSKRNFTIVAISVDKDDSEAIKEFAAKYSITFPILHDRKGKVKEAFKTTGVPETYVIDQNGVIAEKVMGARDWKNAHNIKTILDLLDNGPRTPEGYREGRARKKAPTY